MDKVIGKKTNGFETFVPTVSTSTGLSDADKLVRTSNDGKIDLSLLPPLVTHTNKEGDTIGAIDGLNTLYAIQDIPIVDSLKIYRNGIKQRFGDDIVYNGFYLITFNIAPMIGDTITFAYEI